MFAMARNAVNAYASVGTETGVEAADPHKLVLMLFEGALVALSDGKRHMAEKNIAAKGASLSKAIAIIKDGLRASLDVKAGGELGQRLAMLYDYMSTRLLVANLHSDSEIVDEISGLLSQLRDAWEQIKPGTPAPPQAPPATVRPIAAVYGRV